MPSLALKPKVPVQILAESLEGEPLLFTLERPAGRVVVLNADLDEGDLTLRTAFPIMIGNALAWFSGAAGEFREALSTGAVARLEVSRALAVRARAADGAPGGMLALRSPDGDLEEVALDDQRRVNIGPLDRCGVWSILPSGAESSTTAGAELELAVNLEGDLESDLTPEDGIRLGDLPGAGFGGRPPWFYLALLAFCLTVLDWCLYQRRTLS